MQKDTSGGTRNKIQILQTYCFHTLFLTTLFFSKISQSSKLSHYVDRNVPSMYLAKTCKILRYLLINLYRNYII